MTESLRRIDQIDELEVERRVSPWWKQNGKAGRREPEEQKEPLIFDDSPERCAARREAAAADLDRWRKDRR